MKAIVIALLMFTGAMAQNKNFTIENNLITWRKVFDDSTSISELKGNHYLKFETDTTGLIKRKIVPGGKILLEFTAKFKIEPKKGKYRVSVWNIKYYDTITYTYREPSYNEVSIEKSMIKNGKIRKNSILFYGPSEPINKDLTQLFTIKKKQHYQSDKKQ